MAIQLGIVRGTVTVGVYVNNRETDLVGARWDRKS
jgi:hypothetical protein